MEKNSEAAAPVESARHHWAGGPGALHNLCLANRLCVSSSAGEPHVKRPASLANATSTIINQHTTMCSPSRASRRLPSSSSESRNARRVVHHVWHPVSTSPSPVVDVTKLVPSLWNSVSTAWLSDARTLRLVGIGICASYASFNGLARGL
jgi:hypothetical protein